MATSNSQQERAHNMPANDEVKGRSDNTGKQNSQQDVEDISQMDRQEGNDDPGETGGDFNTSSTEIQKGAAGNS